MNYTSLFLTFENNQLLQVVLESVSGQNFRHKPHVFYTVHQRNFVFDFLCVSD